MAALLSMFEDFLFVFPFIMFLALVRLNVTEKRIASNRQMS